MLQWTTGAVEDRSLAGKLRPFTSVDIIMFKVMVFVFCCNGQQVFFKKRLLAGKLRLFFINF